MELGDLVDSIGVCACIAAAMVDLLYTRTIQYFGEKRFLYAMISLKIMGLFIDVIAIILLIIDMNKVSSGVDECCNEYERWNTAVDQCYDGCSDKYQWWERSDKDQCYDTCSNRYEAMRVECVGAGDYDNVCHPWSWPSEGTPGSYASGMYLSLIGYACFIFGLERIPMLLILIISTVPLSRIRVLSQCNAKFNDVPSWYYAAKDDGMTTTHNDMESSYKPIVWKCSLFNTSDYLGKIVFHNKTMNKCLRVFLGHIYMIITGLGILMCFAVTYTAIGLRLYQQAASNTTGMHWIYISLIITMSGYGEHAVLMFTILAKNYCCKYMDQLVALVMCSAVILMIVFISYIALTAGNT
eukprot:301531_1